MIAARKVHLFFAIWVILIGSYGLYRATTRGDWPWAAIPMIATLFALAALVAIIRSAVRKNAAEMVLTPGESFRLTAVVGRLTLHRARLHIVLKGASGAGNDYGLRVQVVGQLSDSTVFERDIGLGERATGGRERDPRFLSFGVGSLLRFGARSLDGVLHLGSFEPTQLGDGITVSGIVTADPQTEVESLRLLLEK